VRCDVRAIAERPRARSPGIVSASFSEREIEDL
jgi:hypothetical protein